MKTDKFIGRCAIWDENLDLRVHSGLSCSKRKVLVRVLDAFPDLEALQMNENNFSDKDFPESVSLPSGLRTLSNPHGLLASSAN